MKKKKDKTTIKNNQDYTSALIYCRVSSERQKNEGNGLDSQEHRCREYAKTKYHIEHVFKDSFTGGGDFMNRPAMSELIAYLDKHSYKNYVVIFDDLKRFARDREFHFKLRTAFKLRECKLECLNYNFDDSPEDQFVETIFAAQGQLEKDQNRRQVIQKMKARLERGYWPFYPIRGYESITDPTHGKLLKPKYPEANIIKEALEGFASGRFQEQMDVCRFLKAHHFFSKKSKYNLSTTKRLLERVEYAGLIEYPEWEVSRRQGRHEAIISAECFAKVQQRLSGKVMLRTRKDIDADFPLRGFVLCRGCGKEFTSSWSKGRHAIYPYYRCNQQGCPLRNQSVRKEELENNLKQVLKKVTPRREIIDFITARLVMKWKHTQSRLSDSRKKVDNSVRFIQTRIQSLIGMIDENKSPAVIEAYERQIEELGRQELLEKEKIGQLSDKRINFETALSNVTEVIQNPCEYWEKSDLQRRRMLLQMVFAKKLAYSKSSGFETATLQLPIKVFEQNYSSNYQGVEMLGIEPRCN
jgi:site-specific DNA recombinase